MLIAATLAHHVHNTVFLADYPNLPPSVTPLTVMLAWLAATALGTAGYVLFRRDRVFLGCALLGVYGIYGLDALLHYILAPPSAHSIGMNATILFEGLSGALVLAAALAALWRHVHHRRR